MTRTIRNEEFTPAELAALSAAELAGSLQQEISEGHNTNCRQRAAELAQEADRRLRLAAVDRVQCTLGLARLADALGCTLPADADTAACFAALQRAAERNAQATRTLQMIETHTRHGSFTDESRPHVQATRRSDGTRATAEGATLQDALANLAQVLSK